MKEDKYLSINKIKNDNVKQAVYKALENIKANNLFEKDQTILIKPNLLSAKEPERAVTTHPEVVRSVIQWVKQFEPQKIVVSDSSGGLSPKNTERALKKSGILQVCQDEGVACFPMAKSERKVYSVQDPLILGELISSKLLQEADVIINLPKIKTHGLTLLTCCVKNMFGTLISGNKSKLHLQYPRIDDFTSALLDIYSVSKPALTIVDGYYAQEGRGPAAGDIVKMDLILAGYDGIALDALVCNIIGLDPQDVIYLPKAHEKGLGSMDLSEFSLKGEKVANVQRQFKIPKGTQKNLPVPNFLGEYLSDTVFRSYIKIDPNTCRLCGKCWTECPADALSEPNRLRGQKTPNWNKKRCISCYCCAELCPYEAIEFHMHPVKNTLFSPIGIVLILILGLLFFVITQIFL